MAKIHTKKNYWHQLNEGVLSTQRYSDVITNKHQESWSTQTLLTISAV